MVATLRDLPIRRKVGLLIAVASGVTLALAVSGLILYEASTGPARALRDLTTQAELMAINSAASLQFEDSAAAIENLNALRIRHEVGAATLYDVAGRRFVGYLAPGATEDLPATAAPDGAAAGKGSITLTRAVATHGDRVGTLAIRYDFPPLLQRLPQYAAVIGLVLLALLSVGVLLSLLLRSELAVPLSALATTAREVSDRKDYTIRARPHRNDEIGRVTVAFNEMLDTIELRDAALRGSAGRLAEAMDASKLTSWSWDVATGRLQWQGDDQDMFGAAAPAAAQSLARFLELVHPGDRLAVQSALARAASTRVPVDVDFRTVAPDARVRWFAFRGQASTGSPVTHVIGFAQDVTERRHLEDQLVQSQKMEAIGRLAGGIAHDFNNLLTAILGYARFAAAAVPADSPARDDLGQIEKAGTRAAALTAQLLAYARKQIILPRVTDLNELVSHMGGLLQRLLGEDIRLETTCAGDLWQANVDPGQFEQVILNLAVNARDAMERGGQLTIETMNVTLDAAYARSQPEVRPGQYASMTVSDTGSGMDAATAARVFEPFFTTKEQGKGTGLGLAVCYGIIKQAGGHIAVSSEAGAGARFTVYLPRAADAEQRAPAATPAPESDPVGNETVLVVEDDALVRGLVLRTLERLGYRTLEAADGPAAIALAEGFEAPIELVVTDVVMPGMNGKETATRLLAARPGLRVVYMSGYAEHAVVRQGVLDEGIAFLQKPFDAADLARTVRDVLDGVTTGPHEGRDR